VKRKVAMVIQRYGADIIGGAEAHGRQLAEKLTGELGWSVDVFTTTARDYHTWANDFPEGEEWVGGVRVLRFNSAMPRVRWLFHGYDRLTARLMRGLRKLSLTEPLARVLERLWIILQGPFNPKLIRALKDRAGDYEKVIFMTYLYYPTLVGVRAVAEKAILIPTAHDEPAFWFGTVRKMLLAASAILPNTAPEMALIRRQLGPVHKDMTTAGLGFDPAVFAPRQGPSPAARYVLYLGRISRGKGVDQLINFFLAHPASKQGVTLKLVGKREADVAIPNDPSIEYLGFVDDATRVKLLRDAAVAVNPSAHESMSMFVIEAMAMQVPVLVNRHCEVLRHYGEQTTTVFPFGDGAEFAPQLSRVLGVDWEAPEKRRELEATRSWSLERFSWAHVLSVFSEHVGGG
jgi:glycosyltransferase involved in cell wall biosynthesis